MVFCEAAFRKCSFKIEMRSSVVNVFIRLAFVIGVVFSGMAHAYSTADSFRFPLDNYVVGCNPYWGTCVKAWHLGEDAGASATTKVKAIANGIVKEARTASGYGGIYVIEHTLTSGEKVVSVIGHLNIDSFTKKVDDEVNKGDVLGEVGTSTQNGGWSEHVHTGIHKGAYGSGAKCGTDWIYAGYTSCSSIKGEWYDPSTFIRKFYSNSNPMCSRLNSRFLLCWESGTNSSCAGGKDWSLYDFDTMSTIRLPDNHYCPVNDDGGIGGGGSGPEDSSASPPITGGKHPGDLPNLIVHELYLVKEADRDSPHLSQIHIGERSYCNIQVKNTGEAGAWGTWANRCYLSKGNYRDHDPDNLGHESMTDLSAGQSRRVYQIIPAFEYPGKFNITACADTDGNDGDKKIMESDEGDNCHDEYRFDVVSDPNLATTAISLTSIVGNPVINQSFNISSTTTNLGENFGSDYVYIGYFVDGELVGQNQIRRENMKGGMSKAEEIPIHGGIATAGVHEIKACADFTDDIVETNESDNCRILLVNVTAPVSPILSINGVVLANGTRHVFTDERPDISISIGNTGGISSPMTGEVFISSAPHGVENISLGTFQVGAVPEGGNATGTLSGVSFTKLGPWVLTACIEGMTTCASGDVVTVESSHPVNKHVNPAVLMILNKHRRERNER